MNLLNILGEFFRIFVDLLPRIHRRPASNETSIVDAWVFGVRCQHRPVIYVPLFDVVEIWETPNVICITPDIQILSTKDGKSLSVNASVFFRIRDVILCRETFGSDYIDCLAYRCRSAIAEWHNSKNLIEVWSGRNAEIETALAIEFAAGGCEIQRLLIDERCESRALRLLGVRYGV